MLERRSAVPARGCGGVCSVCVCVRSFVHPSRPPLARSLNLTYIEVRPPDAPRRLLLLLLEEAGDAAAGGAKTLVLDVALLLVVVVGGAVVDYPGLSAALEVDRRQAAEVGSEGVGRGGVRG